MEVVATDEVTTAILINKLFVVYSEYTKHSDKIYVC